MASKQLTDLPDEVIQAVLLYVNPLAALALSATCRRLNNLANEPLLWKYYCRTSFFRWDASHGFRKKLNAAEFTDWQDLFAKRKRVDRLTDSLINEIIDNPTGRIRKIEQIVNLGYDAKDILLQRYSRAAGSPKHLALRYWTHVAMGSIHRSLALPRWTATELDPYNHDSLVRALSAFDMFILQGSSLGDVDEIFDQLARYSAWIRQDHANIDDLPPRQKATVVAKFLLTHGLIGLSPGRDYDNLEHNFLGLALYSPIKSSLPLISAVIYCSVVRAFGLRASPLSFPMHVYVAVRPPPGLDLDGHAWEEAQEPPYLFIDPFTSSDEVSHAEVIRFLNEVSNRPVTHTPNSRYFNGASAPEISFRCAHNILGSLSTLRRSPSQFPIVPIDGRAAQYAAYWAIILLDRNAQRHLPDPILHQELLALMYESTENFPWDIALVEKHLLPRLARMPGYSEFERICRSVRLADDLLTQGRPRNRHVKYRIGQVFKHKRYRYTAVITGWDSRCSMTEEWIVNNQVDRLPQGRDQGFYHSLEHDSTMRYVAEENIEPVDNPHDLDITSFPIEIGKYFKRWDKENKIFVSNIKDEYPDD